MSKYWRSHGSRGLLRCNSKGQTQDKQVDLAPECRHSEYEPNNGGKRSDNPGSLALLFETIPHSVRIFCS
jgi:hypothetical protein